MRLDVAAGLFDVELRQRSVVGPRSRDEQVIDRLGKLFEEFSESIEVGGVEGRCPGPEIASDACESIPITRSDDHVGSLGARDASGLETDARAAADHDDGLSGELRFGAHGTLVVIASRNP